MNTKVIVDYYRGAYGPTIRIDTQTIQQLLKVKDAFLKLVEERCTEVNFHQLESIYMIGIRELVLQVTSKEQAQGLKLVRAEAEGTKFVWSRSKEGWRRSCVDLIDGLLEANRPGHQYLTNEGVDDALVELAFLEPRPQWAKAIDRENKS
jgi:hypothetical protein